MKNLKFISFLTIIGCLVFTTSAFAQSDKSDKKEDKDTTIEIDIKTKTDTSKTEIIIKNEDEEDDDDDWESDWGDDDDSDWDKNWSSNRKSRGGRLRFSMLDIGLSSYLFDGSFELPQSQDDLDLLYGGSLNINLHFFRHRLPIIKNTVFFEYGLGVSWMQYKFSNDFKIVENAPEFTVEPVDKDLEKNKLKTTFIEVPVMLTITPGKNDNYFISGGVYGGVLVGAKQKIKTSDGDVNKYRDDFNLNKFRYGVEGRVGLGPVSFYAQYSLKNLFKDNQGPELAPINLGLTLVGF